MTNLFFNQREREPRGQVTDDHSRADYETEPDPQLKQDAMDVARYLGSCMRERGNTYRHIYRDKKIHVECLDEAVPKVKVQVLMGRKPVTVLNLEIIRAKEINRPGRWTEYLAELAEKARAVRDRERAEQEAVRERNWQRRHEPLDDAGFFER